MLCKYGCNQEAIYQFKNGTWSCSKDPNKCPVIRMKKVEQMKEQYKNGKRISAFIDLNKKHPRHQKDVWKHTEETKIKIGRKGRKMSEEFKLKRSEDMIRRYQNGWECKCGRSSKINYFSPIAGEVKLDGSWELKVANYFDLLKVNWIRNKKRFQYFNFLKNKQSSYCPDFFVKEWNSYVEVKGYKTELDDIKWSQFEENLIIFNKSKLKELKIL